jgi:ABC-type transport system involved in multi-copper enzyme maturation permease subunit
MNRSIVRQLIAKDLFLARWFLAGSVAAGLVSIAVMPMSRVSGYVGFVSLICVLVILNIALVMGSVVQERKDRVLLFVLSLPISTRQYTAAKMLSNLTAFVVPWLILTVATIAVVRASRLPDGIIPFWLAILGYLLLYYCVLLAVATVSDSTGLHASVITIGNVSVNFFIPFLLALPSVSANREGPTAVWTTDLVSIVAIELVAAVAAVLVAFYLRSRTPDYV